MRYFALLAALASMLLSLGACADVTLPDERPGAPDHLPGGAVQDLHVQGCVKGGLCLLPPIVVNPGPEECDPWLSLDWCQGDGGDCMTSYQPGDATVQSCPSPGTGAGTGAGGGSAPPPPSDPETCDPRFDPDCHQPLTAADSTTIRIAKQRHQKPASQFTDPAAAQMCAQLAGEFDRLLNSGNVYRGGSVTSEGDPFTPTHVALYFRDTGSMHFEPSALDAANGGDASAIRNIYNSALHEAAHSLGFDHTDPVWMITHDLYTEPPFDLLSPGTNSCIANW